MLDILIRGGLIADGTGNPPYLGDVAIASGRIAALGVCGNAEAKTVIDARGLVVAPGFIDMHSHSDLSLPAHPGATSSLLQGITTEVAGSCGWSLAPLKAETAGTVLKMLSEGLLGFVPEALGVTTGDNGPSPAWHSFGEYLDYLSSLGIGVNLYPIVGQSIIRAHVMGTDRRPATSGELKAMLALLRSCLDEGAHGLSTGRSYYPGAAASTEEIIALARVVAERGGIYTSHIKDEGAEVLEAVEEAVRIGREAGVRVQVSHHKAIGQDNYGKVNQTLALMEQARESGVDITCDVYPYPFAQVFSLLGEVPGVTLAQSLDEIRELLGQADFRDKAADEIVRASTRDGKPPGFIRSADHYQIVTAAADGNLAGRPLATVLGLDSSPPPDGPPDREWVRSLVDRAADLLLSQNLKVHLAAVMNEDDVAAVLAHPETLVGTDAFGLGRELGERTPIHPRHYGTFPRVLGHYRRERGLGDLAGMVRKVTALPARKLRLADRGLLARGNWADVVVFDPETIADRATGTEPYLAPVGIRWVLVNGLVAAQDGQVSGSRAGKVLQR